MKDNKAKFFLFVYDDDPGGGRRDCQTILNSAADVIKYTRANSTSILRSDNFEVCIIVKDAFVEIINNFIVVDENGYVVKTIGNFDQRAILLSQRTRANPYRYSKLPPLHEFKVWSSYQWIKFLRKRRRNLTRKDN